MYPDLFVALRLKRCLSIPPKSGAVGSAYWGRQSLSLVLCTHALAKHNIICCCAATKTWWFFKGLWPVPLIFRNNFALAVSCASIFPVPRRDFSTWFVGVKGLHREMTPAAWLRGGAVSEARSWHGGIGTHRTDAGAETPLCNKLYPQIKTQVPLLTVIVFC